MLFEALNKIIERDVSESGYYIKNSYMNKNKGKNKLVSAGT
jgi:hypothetical protein